MKAAVHEGPATMSHAAFCESLLDQMADVRYCHTYYCHDD